MQHQNHKALYPFALCAILMFFLMQPEWKPIIATASAETVGDISGWLWGGSEDDSSNNADGTVGGADNNIDGNETGVGWISASSLNCDANNDGISDGSPIGCPSAGTSMTSYALRISDFSTGELAGYVWTENLGWISFEKSDLVGCPDGNCVAKLNGYSLEGWARVIGIRGESSRNNAGGWEGWIKIQGTADDGSPYGISIAEDGAFCRPHAPSSYPINCDNTTIPCHCYAWNGEDRAAGVTYGLGWIDFAKARMQVGLACGLSSSSGAVCPGATVTVTSTTDPTWGSGIQGQWNCTNGESAPWGQYSSFDLHFGNEHRGAGYLATMDVRMATNDAFQAHCSTPI